LKNIVDNSNEHCRMCKIMNITQKPFQTRSFLSEPITEIIDNKEYKMNLIDSDLINMGPIKVCEDC